MAVSTPTLDQFLQAVFDELIEGADELGPILPFWEHKEHRWEFFKPYVTQSGDHFEFKLTYVKANVPNSAAGDLQNEDYEIFNVTVHDFTMLVDDEEWPRIATARQQLIVSTLDKNTDVFRIGGQAHVFGTPESARPVFNDFVPIEDHLVIETRTELSTEGRRWS